MPETRSSAMVSAPPLACAHPVAPRSSPIVTPQYLATRDHWTMLTFSSHGMRVAMNGMARQS